MSFSPGPSGLLGLTTIQEQRERWERKRSRTAKELVQTEQRYCQQLELVTTYFVEILKAKGTLKQDIRESIFSSIKAINSVNQSLLVHLENGYFGRGLDQFCPQLHHYNTYVDNIYNASKVLRIQLKKNKAFRRFKELQEARPEFSNHKLEDLLQLPIQRIDQYKHFLQDLTANTSPDNPEFQQISRAVTAVCMVSQRIHKNTQCHQNHLQLCRVQKLLKGRKTKVLAAVLRPSQLRRPPFQPIKLQSHQADFRAAAAAPPRLTTPHRPILLLPTNTTSNVGKRKALPFTDEKRRSPSNILSSSVGDEGGDCETQSLNQWDIDTADSQPVSLGGRRFVSACLFPQFKTKMSHIFYLVSH